MMSKSTKEHREFIVDSMLVKARGLFDIGLFFDSSEDSSNVSEEDLLQHPAQALLRDDEVSPLKSPTSNFDRVTSPTTCPL